MSPDRLGVSVQKRARAFSPKVSTGCITCKIRRIKCDEGRPNCEKCVKTGRKCDGYLPTNQAKRRSRSPGVKTPKLDTCMDQLLILDISGTAEERRGFEFFRSCTVPHLSGFDSSLWHQLILQVSHHEAAIRHAVIALGALHQRFMHEQSSALRSKQNPDPDGFAVQQYVKAMGLLVHPIRERGKQAADVALMACVLFVLFETLRGHHGSALSHIDSGVKIVAEITAAAAAATAEGLQTSASPLEIATTSYVPLSNLYPVFIRLDNQASQLAADRDRKLLNPLLDDKQRGYQAEIPYSFSSIEEARNSLDYVWTASMRALEKERFPDEKGGPTATLDVALKVVQSFSSIILQQWSRAFDGFFKRYPQAFDDASQEHIHIMKMHRILTGIFFGMEFPAGHFEAAWDNYYVEFEAMVAHAIAAVKHSNHPNLTNGLPTPTFSLDTGIILPLYFVITKCRHPSIRRRAIALLMATPRQEGVLNSFLTGRVAGRLVEIEEEGLGDIECAEDVPNWARLSGVEIDFDSGGRRAYLKYMRHKTQEARRRDAVEEWLEW